MRHLALSFALAISTTALAGPELEVVSKDEVTVNVPTGWEHLVTAEENNVVMSRDAGTTITLHWYPYKDGASQDKMLDKLLSVTNENLPLGAAKEVERHEILEGRGKIMTADFSTLGYSMKMGFSVIFHPKQGHIATAIMLASPEAWGELEGPSLIADVTESLQAKVAKRTKK